MLDSKEPRFALFNIHAEKGHSSIPRVSPTPATAPHDSDRVRPLLAASLVLIAPRSDSRNPRRNGPVRLSGQPAICIRRLCRTEDRVRPLCRRRLGSGSATAARSRSRTRPLLRWSRTLLPATQLWTPAARGGGAGGGREGSTRVIPHGDDHLVDAHDGVPNRHRRRRISATLPSPSFSILLPAALSAIPARPLLRVRFRHQRPAAVHARRQASPLR